MPCLTAKVAFIRVKGIYFMTIIYVMIIIFIMFLLKQSTLSAVIFLFVPLVLSLLCLHV